MASTSLKPKRTYASRKTRPTANLPPSIPRKRLFDDEPDDSAAQKPRKRVKEAPKPKPQAKLTQLHFCVDAPIIRRCPKCSFTYTKGADEDEKLHRAHCAKVQKCMDWGRDEEREATDAGVEQIASSVAVKGGKGKIVCVRPTIGGKLGSKLATIMQVVNTELSSPALEPKVLDESKMYLFLLANKVVGCIVASRISTAMAIAPPDADTDAAVSLDTGLFCYPEPLPTPLGIARLFVTRDHRRKGIATKLLDAVARTFVPGCTLDPQQGQVAFTQTTGEGQAIMRCWGGDGVRIYEE